MPQQSRYSNDEFETLMNNVILTLEEGGANRDLSLMVLGNVITHIFKGLHDTCRITSSPACY